MSLEREFERGLGAMLGSGKFWGVVGLLVVVGLFIEHPIAGLVALGCALLLAAWIVYRSLRGQDRRVQQTMPVDGVARPIAEFRCGGCQQAGAMHVERHELPLKSGRSAGWPVAVCARCGYSYEVPGRLG